MTAQVISVSAALPPVARKNILRYLGMGRAEEDPAVAALIDACLPEFALAARCQACYMELPVFTKDRVIDFGAMRVESASLAKNLEGCQKAILFAATLGTQIDLQRRRAAVTSPARALVLDAIGSTAIEAFCDQLCSEWEEKYPDLRFRPRFSPGYGDLPLEFQKKLLEVLDSKRKAGIVLSDALLMIPQKSVSAIVGMGHTGCTMRFHDCSACSKKDCAFRL